MALISKKKLAFAALKYTPAGTPIKVASMVLKTKLGRQAVKKVASNKPTSSLPLLSAALPQAVQSKPADLPFYGAGPVRSVCRAYGKTFRFSGRASRSEYWWYAAFVLGTGATCIAMDYSNNTKGGGATHMSVWRGEAEQKDEARQELTRDLAMADSRADKLAAYRKAFEKVRANAPKSKPSPLTLGVAAATALPYTALSVLRLHDSNLRGWWFLPAEVLCLAPFLYLRKPRAKGVRFDRTR
ncbi:DUF805 domain-containing protein [Rothia aerolata]|uniref:Uncharacterized protein n=1 Tax=Rothia aerolata TaxID=1812262 RepID=A0A917MWN6_9MICC|nr:DUF805 domain-containing protein [Rothia aerolata]GGH65169.1 hypothetical protein GCM10007359_18150 [Rothia aerolata]